MTSPKNKSPELKPCPFCESLDIVPVMIQGTIAPLYHLVCQGCDTTHGLGANEQICKSWNNQPCIKQLEEAKEYCDKRIEHYEKLNSPVPYSLLELQKILEVGK